MRKICLFTVLIFIVLRFVLVGIRQPVQPSYLHIPYISKSLTRQCDWQYATVGNVTCRFYVNGKVIFSSYDVQSRQDMTVYTTVDNKITVGELLLTYGNPVGTVREENITYVYWKSFYIMTVTKRLSPFNRALVVGTISELPELNIWKGFAG